MTSVILSPAQCAKLKTSYVLAASAIAIPNTGNTTENTLVTIGVPAGGMGPNGFIRAWVLWSCNNNGNSKTLRAKLGGTTIFQLARTAQLSDQDLILVRNRNAANSQVMFPLGAAGLAFGNAAVLTAGVNTAVAQNLTITAQLAVAGDSLTLESYQVELFYGA